MRKTSHTLPGVALVLGGLALSVLNGCGAGGGGGGGGGGAADGGDGTVDGPVGPGDGDVIADAGDAELTASLEAGQTATVQLDATGSSSRNGEIVSYEWVDSGCGLLATGATAEVELGVGVHSITLVVTDETGATAEADLIVTVQDERPSNFTLTTAVEGSGQADPPANVPASYPLNNTVTLTATPDPGWQFVGWAGDSDAATASIPVVMDRNRALTAAFQPIPVSSVPLFKLPWAAHETRRTGQGNNGTFSHQDRYAWDYTVDIGTPVLAAGAGRVVRIIDDVPNNTGGTPTDPEAPANMVQLDHGNGLQSLYAHLDQFGVAVVPGQQVVAGQYLGGSGNSGYSTGPHLHFEVLDAAGQSMPSGAVEVVGNDGIAQEGDLVTSQNALDISSFDDYVESSLPVAAFAENNIELFQPTPPAFFYTTGVTYTVTGRVTDRATAVCVALVDFDTEETVYCDPQPVDLDDSFEIDFAFPAELSGNYLLGVVSGVMGVSGVAPVTVWLSPPESENTAPAVAVEQPADDTIDFGETGALRGSASDPDGDALIYWWAQTSGPPATIADPTALETMFTLSVGPGITDVRFQLAASDGQASSLPAEVEFHMPDNVYVTAMGVAEQECRDAESCAAVSAATISAGAESITVWVDLLNTVEGDAASFEIRDPSGEVVLHGRICDLLDESYERLFLRYTWTGHALTPASGAWQGVYLRNGVAEAVAAFTLAP